MKWCGELVTIVPMKTDRKNSVGRRLAACAVLAIAVCACGEDAKAPTKTPRPGKRAPPAAAAITDGREVTYHDAAKVHKKSEGEWKSGKRVGDWTWWHEN